jgi:hypothetical protein
VYVWGGSWDGVLAGIGCRLTEKGTEARVCQRKKFNTKITKNTKPMNLRDLPAFARLKGRELRRGLAIAAYGRGGGRVFVLS